ncbi:O-antigen ligase family protein [Haloimpatiens sp. FM7330]|uniref:O-antigen ligase family protein n=1 Tax=Haloimpatiens sp. FM7330 TaxID=3298610 RepID=UPI00363D04E5
MLGIKDKILSFLICVYIIMMPLFQNKINPKIPATYGDLLLAFIFLVYLVKIIFDNRSRKKFSDGFKNFFCDALTISALILVGIMFISVSYAVDKKLALTESIRFLTYIAVYFIIKYEIDRKDLKVILSSYIISVLLVSLFGILQYFTRINWNPKFKVDYGYGAVVRIHSTFFNPNSLGAFLILAIFPLIMFTITQKKNRIFYGAVTLIVLLNIILTGSRNALLSLSVGLIALTLIYSRKFIVLFIGGVIGAFCIPEVRHRIFDLFNKSQNESRIKLWQTAIAMIKEHPILGIGNGNYVSRYDEYVKKYPYLRYPDYHKFPTHNSYLKIQSELGIVGIISFLGVLISSLFKVKKFISKTNDKILKTFYIGFFASMVAFLFMNISDNMFFVPQIAVFYWILVAMCDNQLLNLRK